MTTFAPLPPGPFACILADPPWRFRVWSGPDSRRGTAETHYRTVSTDDLARLDVGAVAARDAVLFLWTCQPTLPDALGLIEAWGFAYKTVAFAWTKLRRKSNPNWCPRFHVGLGYWTRANVETCLLATRGHPKRLHKDVRQLIVAPVREHSRKPDDQYERIERLVAGPRLELFARRAAPGWTAWGNEAPTNGAALTGVPEAPMMETS